MRLFLDCDGVLADFNKSFEDAFGHPPMNYEARNGSGVFWRDIKNEIPNFYRDLPLMPDAMELYGAVEHMRPIILTGCPRGGWAELQKLEWAKEHFPGVPMIVCMSKDKRDYCKPGDILVDDRHHYMTLWMQRGGSFVLHKSAASSINALQEMGVI